MQLIQDLRRQHEQEVAALLEEKDGRLQKETAATLTGNHTLSRGRRQLGADTRWHFRTR